MDAGAHSTAGCNELVDDTGEKYKKADSFLMEVDSPGSHSQKRRRISSSSDVESLTNSNSSSLSELNDNLTNGSANDNMVKSMLTSKLSNSYRRLVESSKLTVDGMKNVCILHLSLLLLVPLSLLKLLSLSLSFSLSLSLSLSFSV